MNIVRKQITFDTPNNRHIFVYTQTVFQKPKKLKKFFTNEKKKRIIAFETHKQK